MTAFPHRFNATRSRISAFTLVELLVVIGIITLLISILLPTDRNGSSVGDPNGLRGASCGYW